MNTEKDPLLSAEIGENYSIPECAPESARRPREVRFKDSMKSIIYAKSQNIRRITFDSNSHISVLFQMHGSVWPSVLPYCLFNVLLTYVIAVLRISYDIDVTINDNSHSFMGILVAFLIVTRAKTAYGRFMEARKYLQIVYRVSRELVQNTCILTMHDQCWGAKKWRQDIAYQTIVLLRVTMAAIEHNSNQEESSWDHVPDPSSSMTVHVGESITHRVMKWAHGSRTMSDENFRAPLILAYALRAQIMSQRSGDRMKTRRADTKTPMHPNEERALYRHVTQFVAAFHGLKKLITTPFPFPLVQMARTFLFVYTFSLPFALVGATPYPLGSMTMIFFITYGFLGLEYVSIELDDPFGDDPNDFDDLGMAKVVFEDIYMTIYKNDGPESAETLRQKVAERLEMKGSLDDLKSSLRNDMQTSILSILSEESEAFLMD